MPDAHPYGPDEHKEAARALGLRRVEDLLVLARSNDPFLRGTPAHWRDGEWFQSLWSRFGYSDGVHLRRVHYQVLSTGLTLPSGEAYENTEACWGYLCNAGSAARDLGLVDPEAFVDRRNSPPHLYVWPRGMPAVPETVWTPDPDYWTPGSWVLPHIPTWNLSQRLRILGRFEVGGYDYEGDDQPVLLELWIEKSTMDDVLGPVCAGMGINLLSGAGFQSKTATVNLLRRAERHGKPAHVLYVADFDPAGEHMPTAVARQAQFWAGKLDIDVDLTVEVVALTAEQVGRYSLPRIPVKASDARRHGFEARNGTGAVELDALEALYPGQLADIVRHAAHPYVDGELSAELAAAETEAQTQVDEQWQQATADLRRDLGELERESNEAAEAYRERLRALADELAADMAPFGERLDRLRAEARDLIGSAVFALPYRPEAAAPDVDTDGLLYDSRRHWLDQLDAFRLRMGRLDESA